MFEASSHGFLTVLICLLVSLNVNGFNVDITFVENAVAKGAVCLDGSPPAYHIDKGFGAGINNWLILIEGGAWCNNATTCLARKNTRLGSSKKMLTQLVFSGILHNKQKYNPDFYNWNRLKVRYCDGSSFTGDVEAVDPKTNLYYRGARIWRAIIDDLLAKGMKNAENAILAGCSAGGLTAILHCDNFRSLVPASTKVKCLSDAGFFINTKDVSGAMHIQNVFDEVVKTHGSAKNLPTSCSPSANPSSCFFPQYVVPNIKTPLFLINAAYDSWQIHIITRQSGTHDWNPSVKNILAPGVADPHGTWHSCKLDIKDCSSSQLQTLQGFRSDFLDALKGFGQSSSRGMFINSCYAHCQSGTQETWLRDDSPVLRKTTIAKAVGDWYYDRSPFQEIDCPYPCDTTCHNRVFDPDALTQEKFYNQPTHNLSRASVVDLVVKLLKEAVGNSALSAPESGFNDRKTDLTTRVSFKYGCSRGVLGTPSFIVNGFTLPDAGSAIDYNGWRRIIDPLLGKQGCGMDEGGFHFF